MPISEAESLVDVEIPKPEVSGRDLLVRVKAVSVNPVDIKTRQDREGDGKLQILGYDASGIVEMIGDEVTLFKPGDEVYYAGDHSRPGTNMEYHLVDERITGRKPASFGFKEAAAMPLTTITAWESMFERLLISRIPAENEGKSVLIINGAGGVGSIAMQLAKKLAGLRVVATASRTETEEWCRKMGADQVVNHHKPMADEFRHQNLPEPDYILCFNNTAMHMKNMADVIKPQGRICAIDSIRGEATGDLNIFKSKSISFSWEFMFTRSAFKTFDMVKQHQLLNEAAGLFDKGVLICTKNEEGGWLNAENLKKAHKRIESGSMIGKLVLSV